MNRRVIVALTLVVLLVPMAGCPGGGDDGGNQSGEGDLYATGPPEDPQDPGSPGNAGGSLVTTLPSPPMP